MPATQQNEQYVTDAHALVWHITDDKRLGEKAQAILARAEMFVSRSALMYNEDNGAELFTLGTARQDVV